MHDLQRILMRLTADDVELLYLRSDGLTYREISSLLNVTEGALLRRYHRLIQVLQTESPEFCSYKRVRIVRAVK
jgi:DNA-directed RNA polymerase specialized sigma24 family protein